MIEIAFQSTVIFALATAANAMLRSGSAAQRHSVWMLGFVAIPFAALLSRAGLPVPTAVTLPGIAISSAPVPATIGSSIDLVAPIWITISLLLLARLAYSYVKLLRRPETVASPFTFGILHP